VVDDVDKREDHIWKHDENMMTTYTPRGHLAWKGMHIKGDNVI
jgi:hypothetical protein